MTNLEAPPPLPVRFLQWQEPAEEVHIPEPYGTEHQNGWRGPVRHGLMPPQTGRAEAGSTKGSGGKAGAEFDVLQGLASRAEVAEILHLGASVLEHSVRCGSSRWSDSVDALPTFEYHFMVHGRFQHEGMERVLRPLIDGRILPFMRERYACPQTTMCTVLFRRYKLKERCAHPVHFDREAFATAVLGLNPHEYTGGLYVQGDAANAHGRCFVPLGPGDVVIHRFDLRHGVEVAAGTRFSMVFWAKDSVESCATGATPWYFTAAHAGDADAQFNLGLSLADPLECGRSRNLAEGLRWCERAAAQGHVQALSVLAKHYWEGVGLERDEVRAKAMWRCAAESGCVEAQRNLGGLLVSGAGDCPAQPEEGLRLLCLAAAQGDLESILRAGLALRSWGDPGAVAWLQEAARRGHPVACMALAELLRAKEGITNDSAHDVVGWEAQAKHCWGSLDLSCREACVAKAPDLPRRCDAFLIRVSFTDEELREARAGLVIEHSGHRRDGGFESVD